MIASKLGIMPPDVGDIGDRMSLSARNLLLVAIGVLLVACVRQWHLHSIEEMRERLTRQADAELPLAEQHKGFSVIVLIDPSFVPELLVAAGIGCVAYRLNLRHVQTRGRHPIVRNLMISGGVAALSCVLSVGAEVVGTMAGIRGNGPQPAEACDAEPARAPQRSRMR